MQIDQLQIELRPRSDAQALDLGFALLRSHASATYMAFLALWLPFLALLAGLTILLPEIGGIWILCAWWFKPMFERAPLYLLSRQVFGNLVSWQEAVRAWPRQLGGGWFRLLTWWRPFAAARGLYQPIWQLENARGKIARSRMQVIGRDGTSAAAFWFGIVCAHLEIVLQLGAFGLIGIFLSEADQINPLKFFIGEDLAPGTVAMELTLLLVYGATTAIITPIYTACSFTLYLNRRASLEAWDIELQLRQISRPVAARPKKRVAQTLVGILAACLLWLPFTPPSEAATENTPCTPPAELAVKRAPHHSADQARLRKQLDQIFASEDLRGYSCVNTWVLKKTPAKLNVNTPLYLELIAQIVKMVSIAAAIGIVVWLLVRYRHRFPQLGSPARIVAATEVAGLDIRAASLPADVTASVRQLWASGQGRAALALLYRATLSRLVSDDGLVLGQGSTEGDCLRLASAAESRHQLNRGRLDVTVAATSHWLGAAYADRWPDEQTLFAHCTAWDAQFAIPSGSAN